MHEPINPDQLAFEKTKTDLVVLKLLPFLHSQIYWRAINSLRHLNRAWKIKEVDVEMSWFRAITAEEEAAAALILSFKRLRYPGADKLDHDSHLHKNSIYPMIYILRNLIAPALAHLPDIYFDIDTSTKKYQPYIYFQIYNEELRKNVNVRPDMPLNVILQESKDKALYQPIDLVRMMNENFNQTKKDELIEILRQRANTRNRILYASDSGIPVAEGNIDQMLVLYKQEVFSILLTLTLVDLYSKPQNLATQCLVNLLTVLKKTPPSIIFK